MNGVLPSDISNEENKRLLYRAKTSFVRSERLLDAVIGRASPNTIWLTKRS